MFESTTWEMMGPSYGNSNIDEQNCVEIVRGWVPKVCEEDNANTANSAGEQVDTSVLL
jgi:hypothetical protein